MNCNNIISFENVVKTPIGLEYFDNNQYSIVVNTNDLDLEIVPVEYSSEVNTCEGLLQGTYSINEVRVSGSIIYSVGVDALDTSDNKFNIEATLSNVTKAGWLSESSLLPIWSYNSSMTKVPYIVIKYIQTTNTHPTNDDIKVTLNKLNTKLIVTEDNKTLIILEGEFKINIV